MTILKLTPEEASRITCSHEPLEKALEYVASLVKANQLGRGTVTIIIQRKRNAPKRS